VLVVLTRVPERVLVLVVMLVAMLVPTALVPVPPVVVRLALVVKDVKRDVEVPLKNLVVALPVEVLVPVPDIMDEEVELLVVVN